MKNLVLFAALFAAGCVVTPADLKTSVKPNTYQSAQAPRDVAQCLGRNNVHAGGDLPVVIELERGALEVLFRDRNVAVTHVYALLSPAPSGTAVQMWTYLESLRNTIEPGLLKGC